MAVRLFDVECKPADAPRLTPSIRIAPVDVKLERVARVAPAQVIRVGDSRLRPTAQLAVASVAGRSSRSAKSFEAAWATTGSET
jgi:hypothetical protein